MNISPKKLDIIIGVHEGGTWFAVQVPRGVASEAHRREALALLTKVIREQPPQKETR